MNWFDLLYINKWTDTDLWPLRDVFGTVSDEADGFHAGVWEGGITGKLWQTLNCILEWVNGGRKVLLKYIRWEMKGKE